MQTTVRQDGAVEWRVSGLSGKLPLMIPWRKPGRVEVNGKPVSAAPSNRLGIPYLFVPVEGTSGAETRVTYRSS
jgi:hypothetical protein